MALINYFANLSFTSSVPRGSAPDPTYLPYRIRGLRSTAKRGTFIASFRAPPLPISVGIVRALNNNASLIRLGSYLPCSHQAIVKRNATKADNKTDH